MVRGNAATIMYSTWFDERDHRRMPIELSVIPSTFIIVSGMLPKAISICENLILNPERMQENLKLLKGLNLSEIIATALALRGLGRYTAYSLMREIAQSILNKGQEFREVLKAHQTVRQYLKDEDIDKLLDFSSSLGLVQTQIEATLAEIEI